MPSTPGEQPKYREIAADLRRRIDAGEYPPGAQLPTEKSLMDRYSVAHGTIRQALAALRDEGVTQSHVGSGVYVREFRPIIRNALKRLSAEQWGEGKSIWEVDVEERDLVAVDMQIERLPASADVASALGLEEGDAVWRRSRRYLVDDIPVVRAVSHIPDDLASGTRITQVDTGAGGIYARLKEAGHGPVKYREELRCRMPSAEETEDLSLLPATPVVEIRRWAYGAEGRTLEMNRMILDASKYLLVYDFPA